MANLSKLLEVLQFNEGDSFRYDDDATYSLLWNSKCSYFNVVTIGILEFSGLWQLNSRKPKRGDINCQKFAIAKSL